MDIQLLLKIGVVMPLLPVLDTAEQLSHHDDSTRLTNSLEPYPCVV